MSACPNCGHDNEAAAKFCSECGMALVGATRFVREGEALLAASA